MPRNGDNSSDNAIEAGENIVHGATGDTSLNRTSKTAPKPEHEKGGAIEGLGASGGGSVGVSGKGGEKEGAGKK